MKKFLLSIFAVMLAVFSVQAEEVSGTITFKTSGSDQSNSPEASSFVTDLIKSSDFDGLTCTETNKKSYVGVNGVKMSSSSVNGYFTLNLGETYNVKSITVNAVKFKTDAASLSVNSATAQTLTTSLADYTFEINKEISTIRVDMTKRGYIASITIVYETVGEGGGTVEPDPEPETPENIEGATVDFTASQKYSADTSVDDVEIALDSYVTAKFSNEKGGSAPKYYANGTSIRWYAKNTLTIASTAGNITEIVLTFGGSDGSNEITANVGSYESGTWTGAAQSVTFTVGGSSGNRRIAGITVTYAGKSAGEPEIINVEQPVISSDKAEYAVGEEAVVTITTATEGATIYYSLDGSEPTTVYTEPIVLDETTTVKAVAKMEGANDSPLAEKIIEFKKVVTLVNATVAEVIAAYESGDEITKGATVVGYIVGTIDGNAISKAVFGTDVATLSNILLADDPNETNIENCIPVNLPTGDIRTALNLVDNPDNYLKKVVLTGDVVAYFTVAGLKSVSAYEFVEEEEPVAETWSSFYAVFPVAIPEGVEAYIVTAANAGYVTLTQIYNAVPANTGVILKGGSIEATNDNYYSGEVTEVTGNLLKGTMTNAYISEEAYVLGKVDGVIGLYKAKMTDGQWLNNANKAYLPASEVPAAAQGAANFSFRFEGEGTTAIENVEVENEVKAIFDLTGRRVENVTAPGIYVVNGKKVLVK